MTKKNDDTKTGFFRGEGGSVQEFDLPLAEVYANQVRQGRLVEVSGPDGPAVSAADSSVAGALPQLVGPGQTIAARPQDSASVDVWRDYATAVVAYGGVEAGGVDAGAIDKMSKKQLIDAFGTVQSGPN